MCNGKTSRILNTFSRQKQEGF